MDKQYLVKSNQAKWPEAITALFSQEGPAIEHAKQRAIDTGTPHDVYEIELIGTSTIPTSQFADRRPQPVVDFAAGAGQQSR